MKAFVKACQIIGIGLLVGVVVAFADTFLAAFVHDVVMP